MEIIRTFSGETEAELWEQIATDMEEQGDILEYAAEVKQQDRTIYFKIDIDLGGGFEGGYETTTFITTLPTQPALRFHIHPEDWVSEIGKFLGMEDVQLGFPRFDKVYIVKTNQPETLKALFADDEIRATLRELEKCDLKLTTSEENEVETTSLSLFFESGITNPPVLQAIYHLMLTLADKIEKLPERTV